MTPQVYRKHNSFVDIRLKKPLADVRSRLERLFNDPSDMGLDKPRAELVRRACSELLGRVEPPSPHARFELHVNVIEELARLADEELPRYLHYRYRYETYPDRKQIDDFPPCIQIEPTSVCNFRCVFCY